MNTKSVILLGATGLVGGACLKRLLDHDEFHKVIVFTRRPLLHQSSKLTSYLIDFNQPQSYDSLVIADCVICCLGTTMKKAGSKQKFYQVDFTYPYDIAKAALKNGAEQFVLVSALGADPQSLFFYNRTKGELEQAILHLGFKAVRIFRPSLLVGNRDEFRIGEEIGNYLSKFFNFIIPKRYKPTSVDKLVNAIIQEALNSQQDHRIIESHEI
ncbi:MAG: NAD(P)H-binding protein [Desulfobacterales bacterium]|nr:NAD(P)H-binding protein [Desulfobacterales bacterium]